MKRVDFRLRLLLAAVLPSLLMAATLGVFWWNWTQQTLESALRERVTATARQLATAAEIPLFSGDVQSLSGMLDSIGGGDAELLGVGITDPRGVVLVKSGEAHGFTGTPPLSLTWSQEHDDQRWHLVLPVMPTPIYIDDMIRPGAASAADDPLVPLGYVVLDVSLQRLDSMRNNMLILGAVVITAAILLSIILMIRLARGVIRPLSRIIKGVEAMGKGELDARIENIQGEVFQPLANVINQMAEGVKLTQIEMQQRIDAATLELRQAKSQAEQEARIDSLTGLCNRRAFMERASDELLRARRYGHPLAVAMIDIDFFKRINDQWGHAIGDQVLMAFADILKKSMRAVDIIARIGGEEFVLMMTETPIEEAMQVAERIRKDVESASLQLGDTRLQWTASFGITILYGDDYSVSTALVRADKALYRAKDAGRNRVEVDLQDVTSD